MDTGTTWRRGNTYGWPAFFGMSEARWKVHRAADDAPPPWFSDLKHIKGPTGDWTPREELGFMLWVFIDAGATYDEAVVEVNAVTTVFQELGGLSTVEPPADAVGSAEVIPWVGIARSSAAARGSRFKRDLRSSEILQQTRFWQSLTRGYQRRDVRTYHDSHDSQLLPTTV